MECYRLVKGETEGHGSYRLVTGETEGHGCYRLVKERLKDMDATG